MTAANDPEKDRSARYAFAVRFRLDASTAEWRVDTRTVERTCYREAPLPGEPGWLFFRDYLWRGECNHPEHLARLVGEAFDLPVENIEFRGLRTDKVSSQR